jgi:hypothetical protein
MCETSYLLLRTTTTRMLHELRHRRDNEWHTGDEYDKITGKIDRLERFMTYVELRREFSP